MSRGIIKALYGIRGKVEDRYGQKSSGSGEGSLVDQVPAEIWEYWANAEITTRGSDPMNVGIVDRWQTDIYNGRVPEGFEDDISKFVGYVQGIIATRGRRKRS